MYLKYRPEDREFVQKHIATTSIRELASILRVGHESLKKRIKRWKQEGYEFDAPELSKKYNIGDIVHRTINGKKVEYIKTDKGWNYVRVVHDDVKDCDNYEIDLYTLAEVVATITDVPIQSLLIRVGRKSTTQVARAKQMLCYFAVNHTTHNLFEVARLIHYKTHTSVIYSANTISSLAEQDELLRKQMGMVLPVIQYQSLLAKNKNSY